MSPKHPDVPKPSSAEPDPQAWDVQQRLMADSHTAPLCPEHRVQFGICGCSEGAS